MSQTTPNYCTLYLVRHGETEWNAIRRIQGQLDSPLTEKGKQETLNLAKNIQHLHFDAIFASDLGRTIETAQILKLDRDLTINTEKALRERTFGEHDGSLGVEYEKAIRHLLVEFDQLNDQAKWNFKFAKGYESDAELVSRFITKLREIAIGYPGKTILVVTHGGNLRTLLTHLGFAKYGDLNPGTFKNNGYVKLRCDGVDFFIDQVEGVNLNSGITSKTL